MSLFRFLSLSLLIAALGQMGSFEVSAQSAVPDPGSAATPQLEFTVDGEQRKFLLIIKNQTDQSFYLLTHNEKLWCFHVEVWDRLQVGYRLSIKEAIDASKAGAFLGDWGLIEVKPSDNLSIDISWNSLDVFEPHEEPVRLLLEEGVSRKGRVKARIVVLYRNSADYKSKEMEAVSPFIDVES